ncbi:MAG: hypothetical protein ACW97W_03965 [Candidatus Hodarchaeales archaeon]|jgi:hypothetical protein
MNDIETDGHAKRFQFRSFNGIRRGRIYRLCAVSWGWWKHQWQGSRLVKILMAVLLLYFVLTNLLMLSLIDMKRQANPDLTNTDILRVVLLQLVRGVVSFQTEFYASGEVSESFMFSLGGLSILFCTFMVLIGSGLIADDVSNKMTDIYFSKLERYDYIIGKYGAFMIFGNIVITLPSILEFFLLFVGIGKINFISVFPLLFQVILITEVFIVIYASIFLSFSALTQRKLYAGITAFMFIFITNMVIPTLAFASEGEINLAILFDILSLLLISSYILEGVTDLRYIAGKEFYSLNLVSGSGIDSWIIMGALAFYVGVGLLVVSAQVYWKRAKN